jgi:hypothetical protein
MLKAWERELYLFSNDDDYRKRVEAKEHFPLLYSGFSLSGCCSKCYVPFKDIATDGFGTRSCEVSPAVTRVYFTDFKAKQ